MPVIESYENGTPSWVDLSTTDPDGAKDFYHALFGWEFTDEPAGEQGIYTMARLGVNSAAGMMRQAPEQAAMGIPPLWNTYITSYDIEDTLGKVEGAGGSVMVPTMDVMEAGRMAVIVDPTGAVVALWEPKAHIGCEVVNEPGALVWNELTTSEISVAKSFYEQVFGWSTESVDMPDGGVYTMFQLGDQPIAGVMAPPDAGIPPAWGVIFSVADCGAALETVTENGGTVLDGPIDIGVGTLGIVMDPQGTVFQLMQAADEG